ncbi:MFS transporter [Mycolicibacterium duvalii]|nr:MFS transporter [Mycolicibacterium duvalii]MCV7366296.1 MFS transporter [Mycolicibacterium duvalii]PEG41097.1 MFS transporter [Mycolicibacterium duvalii]
MFAIAWGGNEFTPLLVMYRTDGGFSGLTVDLLLFAYVIGIVPALLMGGPLSDRVGRRPLMLPAPVLAAVGSAILAFGAQSALVLGIGRVFSGLALGLAMAVGGSWLKELSSTPLAGGDAGARRAAMSLTGGFGLGAGAAGMLAEWAPAPTVTPYAVNIATALAAALFLTAAPETRAPGAPARPWRANLVVARAAQRRFAFVVVPVAPWVFGAGATAYAVLPALMSDRVSTAPIAFSALMCVVTLGVGFAVQRLGPRLGADGPRGVVIALGLLVVGMLAAALAASALTVWAALGAAAALGAGYGLALLAGLQEIQRIAGPDDLAGMTAVFYSLSYLGFAVPAALSVLERSAGYPTMFVLGALAAALCLLVAAWECRRGAAIS